MIKEEQIIKQLKSVIDPELNVNIVDLGLIYEVKIELAKKSGSHLRGGSKFDVTITMTLTTPGCPLSYVFEAWIPETVKKIKGVKNVHIDLVWEPPWDPEKMSDSAKESLGIIK